MTGGLATATAIENTPGSAQSKAGPGLLAAVLIQDLIRKVISTHTPQEKRKGNSPLIVVDANERRDWMVSLDNLELTAFLYGMGEGIIDLPVEGGRGTLTPATAA